MSDTGDPNEFMLREPLSWQVREGERGYHVGDSLCFIRQHDGAVRVTMRGLHVVTLSPEQWPTAVAAMSFGGLTTASYERACDEHGPYRRQTEEGQ